MASSCRTVSPISTALVLYDPRAPQVSIRAHLEAVSDRATRHSLEIAKFAAKHLGSLEERLMYLAHNLPKMVPFPFSGVIALQSGDGRIVQVCHYPHQPSFTTEQTFNVLSVGKLFTATAVMQLIEEGKFSFDTPLSKLLDSDELDVPLETPYLEQKPNRASLAMLKQHSSEITVRHLLSHTAGFVDREGSEEDGIAPGQNWDRRQIGKDCYSNYGYQLLGRIVGKHTICGGSSVVDHHEARFRAHIEERIFKPAGMEGALREIDSPTKYRPVCFEVSREGVVAPVEESRDPYPHGNGCWRMTARDLLAFSRAIPQHNLLLRRDSFNRVMHYQGRLGFWVDRD